MTPPPVSDEAIKPKSEAPTIDRSPTEPGPASQAQDQPAAQPVREVYYYEPYLPEIETAQAIFNYLQPEDKVRVFCSQDFEPEAKIPTLKPFREA